MPPVSTDIGGISNIQPMPGRLHKAAIASICSSFGADATIDAGGVVRPENDFPTVAVIGGIGLDSCFLANVGGLSILNISVLPLIVAAHKHRAATGDAGCIYGSVVYDSYLIAEYLNGTAFTGASFGLNNATNKCYPFAGLHRNVATLHTVGCSHTPRLNGELFGGFQKNPPAGIHHCTIRADPSRLAHDAAVYPDPPRISHKRAEVDRLMLRGADHHCNFRVAFVKHQHLIASCQQYIAVRGGDDAAVGNIRSDQIHLAAAGDRDGPLVLDFSGDRSGAEVHLAGQEVLIADTEGGSDQAANVNA